MNTVTFYRLSYCRSYKRLILLFVATPLARGEEFAIPIQLGGSESSHALKCHSNL